MKENKFFDTQVHEILSLDELARQGAQQMIRIALEAEIAVFMDTMKHRTLDDGKPAVVRNGTHKLRQITVGSGAVSVSVPRTRSRDGGEDFRSIILPPYMRRSPKIDEVVPLLYLRGLSNGDIYPALSKLLGENVSSLNLTKPFFQFHQTLSRFRQQ